MNPLINTLMQNLMNRNPNGYKTIVDAMNNKGKPEDMLQQVFGNYSTEQRQQILNQARMYGCPNDILSKLQNMK